MAISDVDAYAHLTADQVDELGAELDRIRAEVVESLGERDHRYIHTVIRLQRGLEVGARALLMVAPRNRTVWAAGTTALAAAKIVENMELGHNIMHGQWDWMNDPEIHSTSWEWDLVGRASDWKSSHNHHHHKYTNIVGMDDDVGFGVLRVTRDVPWEPRHAANIPTNAFLMLLFEWGIGLQKNKLRHAFPGGVATDRERADSRAFLGKAGRQLLKDYVFFPMLSGPAWTAVLGANLTANLARNIWTNAVIFCGHFPDGAEKFTIEDTETEDRSRWYLRQMLGSANLSGGPVMDFFSGNLSFQIEHHMFPDLPSNRYAEVSLRVRELCERYDLPYVSGPLWAQYLQSWRTIARLSLPNRFLRDDADDATETRSERMFEGAERAAGLASALRERVRDRRHRFARRRPTPLGPAARPATVPGGPVAD